MPQVTMTSCPLPRIHPLLAALILSAWAYGVGAASIGELHVQSALGQTFAAKITVTAGSGEQIRSDCFSAQMLEGGIDGSRRQLGLRYNNATSTLQLTGWDALLEPIIALNLKLQCDTVASMQRDYTVLLDLPASTSQSPTLPAPSAGKPSPQDSTPPLPSEWMTQGGETYASIARQLLPGQREAQLALVQALRRLNAHLPPRGKNPLGPGILLKLPPRQALKPALRPAGPSKLNRQPTTQLEAAPRLTLSPPQQGPIAGAADAPQSEQTTALEKQLAQKDAELEASRAQVSKLEQRLNSLILKVQQHQAVLNQPKPTPSTTNNWPWLGLLTVVIGAILASLALLYARRKAKQSSELEEFIETPPANLQRVDDEQHFDTPPAPILTAHSSDLGTDHGHEGKHDLHNADNLNVVYLSDVAAEATLLAAYGQFEQAINLLRNEIRERPTHVVNWIQLLELLHSQGDKAAFLSQAYEFRQNFISETMWEKISKLGRELLPDEALFNVENHAATDLTSMLDEIQGQANPAQLASPPTSPSESEMAVPLLFELEQVVPSTQEVMPLPLHSLDFDLSETPSPEFELILPPEPAGEANLAEPDNNLHEQLSHPELNRARLLIQQGQLDQGAAVLELLLVKGSYEEKIAAGEMLVKLTSPRAH